VITIIRPAGGGVRGTAVIGPLVVMSATFCMASHASNPESSGVDLVRNRSHDVSHDHSRTPGSVPQAFIRVRSRAPPSERAPQGVGPIAGARVATVVAICYRITSEVSVTSRVQG
jgi:hypothetical protein